MVVEIYGKEGCKLCTGAKKKVGLLLNKWNIADKVSIHFQDMETVDGAAEGAFYDVLKIPTTLVKDGEKVLARWDGGHPKTDKLFSLFEPLIPQAKDKENIH